MVQFVLVMIHAFQLLFIDCNYPKAFVWWIGMHAVMFYFLFRNFYNETYNKKSKVSSKQTRSKNLNKSRNNVRDNSNSSNENGVIYANQYKMATGYISDNGLRNRVFLDNRSFDE